MRLNVKPGTFIEVLPSGIKIVHDGQMMKIDEPDVLPIFDAILALYDASLKIQKRKV